MKDSTGIVGRWRARPPAARTVAAAIVTLAGLALPVACGGGPSSGDSSHAGRSTNSPSVLGFSDCMRSHGVTRFPDPVDEVDLPKISPEILGVSSSQFNAAAEACQHLLPPVGELSRTSDSVERCIVGGICPPAVTHWLQNLELKYARCMRSHGLPNWPDPTTDAQGRLNFEVPLAWAQSPPEPQSGICERQTGAPIR